MERWTTFATAAYLCQSYDTCISAIDSLLKISDSKECQRPLKGPQKLEVLVLNCKALIGKKEYKDALVWLFTYDKYITNKLQLIELRAQIFTALGNTDEAVKQLEMLLERNSCNYETYYKILDVRGVKLFNENGEKQILDSAQEEKMRQIMDVYVKGFGKVNAH